MLILYIKSISIFKHIVNVYKLQSPNSATTPQDPIQRITSLYPEDPRAPFYDPSGREMPPLARLYVTLDSLVHKSCSDKTEDELLQEVAVADNSEDSNRR